MLPRTTPLCCFPGHPAPSSLPGNLDLHLNPPPPAYLPPSTKSSDQPRAQEELTISSCCLCQGSTLHPIRPPSHTPLLNPLRVSCRRSLHFSQPAAGEGCGESCSSLSGIGGGGGLGLLNKLCVAPECTPACLRQATAGLQSQS